ncbi:MAG: carbohydrate binding family 9 domain-containing protein, partial [Longimicrobiales bacterium]
MPLHLVFLMIRRAVPISALALLVTSGTLAAQTPIDLDTAPRPRAAAARAVGPVTIDGVLDDATWAAAPVIDQFWQQKPDAGMPATERTEVRILFDDEHLYIGAELMEQPGYEPIIPTLQRDPNTRDGDAFGMMFDPFLDGTTVFSFFFNPGGAVRDIQTADDGRINNAAWDAAFDLRTRVHDEGWTLELAIPWSQLRFDASREEQVWGLNLLRRIRRKNEDATW